MQNYKKITVKFEELSLEVWVSPEHEWLMETTLVALGYGVSDKAIYAHASRNEKEFIEDKHYLILQNVESGQIRNVKYYTKRGVIRLGFFIKSERAKLFRDWAEDLIINHLNTTETIPAWFVEFQEMILQRLDKLEKRTATLPENMDAFVYIIHNPDSDAYKIGHTQDVSKRSKDGRTFLPNLQVVMTIPCPDTRYAIALENFLHSHFYKHRINMEWYRLSTDDLILIHEMMMILGLV